MSWNFSCFLISPSSSSQRYVPWNVYWVDHLIIISNIIIACSANTANTPSHEASVSAIARTVGHHLMDAFSWLDHPWLGRPMRHKAIFHRNVCSNSGVFSLHKTYCTVTMFQSSLSSASCLNRVTNVWTQENVEQLEQGLTHESLHDLAPRISQNCEILFSE